MNRRDFVKSTLIASGAVALTSCDLLSNRSNDQIHIAAIGCGRMGRSNIKNFLAVAEDYNAIFTAVCDLDERRVAEGKTLIESFYSENGTTHTVKTYGDYHDLLRDRSIDVVLICTPDHSHGKVAIDAAKAGKDIYLEKPLTYTIEEGQQLVKAVRRKKQILQTGTQQRSSVYFRRVCELVRTGKIGQLEKITVRIPMDSGVGNAAVMPVPSNLNFQEWLKPCPSRPYTLDRVHPQQDFSRPGWMQTADHGHGMITNWGVHMLDIAHWGGDYDLSGPVSVEATADFTPRGLWDVHTTFHSFSEFSNGVKLELKTLSPEEKTQTPPSVKFEGSDGWAFCARGSANAMDKSLLREDPNETPLLYVSKHHHRNFLECVRSRKDPICPVEIGHRSNSECLIHLIAAKLGRPLKWDPVKERFENDDTANRMIRDMRI